MRIICLTLLSLAFAGCVFTGGRIKGNGDAATEMRQPGRFKGVELHASYGVEVRQGATHAVEVRADRNLLPYITTVVEGNNLIISNKSRSWLSPRSRIKIIVTAPALDELHVSGSGTINSSLALSAGNVVAVDVSGSGTINAPVDAPVTEVRLSGSGDIDLRGQTRDLNTRISGSGDVRCFDLASEATTVSLTGSGDAEVYASKRLDVSLSGSGDVQYKGKPAITKNKTGSGSIAAAE